MYGTVRPLSSSDVSRVKIRSFEPCVARFRYRIPVGLAGGAAIEEVLGDVDAEIRLSVGVEGIVRNPEELRLTTLPLNPVSALAGMTKISYTYCQRCPLALSNDHFSGGTFQ
ncbi:hypothetical protein M2428_003020 [Arthrobacter sp. ES3-54]|nr:hypothetical protein [Arthrobacter sp. ES3-54]